MISIAEKNSSKAFSLLAGFTGRTQNKFDGGICTLSLIEKTCKSTKPKEQMQPTLNNLDEKSHTLNMIAPIWYMVSANYQSKSEQQIHCLCKYV